MQHITPQTINALRWFAARGPVAWFDKSAPGHSMRTRLIQRGLIERVPDNKPVRMIKLRLSEAGREILVEGGWL